MRQPVAEVDIFTSPDEPATDEKADLQRPKRARQERPSRAKPNPGKPKSASDKALLDKMFSLRARLLSQNTHLPRAEAIVQKVGLLGLVESKPKTLRELHLVKGWSEVNIPKGGTHFLQEISYNL